MLAVNTWPLQYDIRVILETFPAFYREDSCCYRASGQRSIHRQVYKKECPDIPLHIRNAFNATNWEKLLKIRENSHRVHSIVQKTKLQLRATDRIKSTRNLALVKNIYIYVHSKVRDAFIGMLLTLPRMLMTRIRIH